MSPATPEFGITVHTMGNHVSAESVTRQATTAEESGFDAVMAGDHVVFPEDIPHDYPFSRDGEPPAFFDVSSDLYDVFETLSYVAGATDDLRVGTNTCIVPYRHPVHLVKSAFTLDALSEGRFDFGLAAGWLRTEFEELDVPFEERGGRTDEFLGLYRRACDEAEFSFDGEYHSFQEVGFHPQPSGDGPRVYVGGRSGAALRRVAEFGDGWTTNWDHPSDIADMRSRLLNAWTDFDRDGDPEIVLTRPVHVGSDPDRDASRPLIGDADTIIEDVQAYVDAGTTRIMIDYFTTDLDEQCRQIRRFGEAVIPSFA